jgi:hypothetical protein
VRVQLEGTDLPGRRCGQYTNVHVALQRGRDPWEITPADSECVNWTFEVRLRQAADGQVDFAGPFVHGPRGERFIYIMWGEVAADGRFTMFRRAKVPLAAVPRNLLATADAGPGVAARLVLTDGKGMATTSTIRPPLIEWRAAPG